MAPQDAFTEEIWVYKDMIADLGFELPAFGDSYTVDEWVEIGKAAKENSNNFHWEEIIKQYKIILN